jgi:hypothetical protein
MHPMVFGFWCAACATAEPAFMLPVATIDTVAPPDAARIVFVRESSACDQGEPFRLVDERLQYVGDSPPGSKFAVLVAPGHHAFFAWQPLGDVPPEQYPLVNQVGGLQGDFAAGRTYYVAVSIENGRFALRKTCEPYQWLALRAVDPADPGTARVLAGAKAWVPDGGAGQRAVDADRSEVARHVTLGMQALRWPADVGPPDVPITWPPWRP